MLTLSSCLIWNYAVRAMAVGWDFETEIQSKFDNAIRLLTEFWYKHVYMCICTNFDIKLCRLYLWKNSALLLNYVYIKWKCMSMINLFFNG